MAHEPLPEQLWLGRTDGQWPIIAFERQVHAIHWLESAGTETRRIWRATIDWGPEYRLQRFDPQLLASSDDVEADADTTAPYRRGSSTPVREDPQ